MTKVLKFELSKRLNDLWLLDNIKSNYLYYQHNETWNYEIVDRYEIIWDRTYICKTLTLEEAIEFLPCSIKWFVLHIKKNYPCRAWEYFIYYEDINGQLLWYKFLGEKTPIEAIEKMLDYLLDNNLLTK